MTWNIKLFFRILRRRISQKKTDAQLKPKYMIILTIIFCLERNNAIIFFEQSHFLVV